MLVDVSKCTYAEGGRGGGEEAAAVRPRSYDQTRVASALQVAQVTLALYATRALLLLVARVCITTNISID